MNNQAVKLKITHIVGDYKRFMPNEYAAFLSLKKEKEPLDRYAEIKGTDLMERHLLEYPQTLYVFFKKMLLEDEWKWFISKVGQRWFASRFKDFAVPEKI